MYCAKNCFTSDNQEFLIY